MGRYRTKQCATSVTDVGGRQLLDIVLAEGLKASRAGSGRSPMSGHNRYGGLCCTSQAPTGQRMTESLPHADQAADPFHGGTVGEPATRRSPHKSPERNPRTPCTQRRLTLWDTAAPHRSVGTDQRRGPNPPAASSTLATPTEKSEPTGRPINRQRHLSNRQHCRRPLLNPLASPRHPRPFLPTRDQPAWPNHRRWKPQITNWHISKVTNGPTEALNNLIKRIKRDSLRVRNLANYRVRALLYAGKPKWNLLATGTPH